MAKRRSYFQKALSHTWNETEWVPVIIEDMSAGIAIAVLAAILKICQWDEFRELAFLIVGTALCGFVFGFIYRFIFVTPPRLIRELERKVKTLESKLQNHEGEIPLGIEAAQDKPTYKNTAVTTILICLCTGLALILVIDKSENVQLKKQIPPPNSHPIHFDTRPATKKEEAPQLPSPAVVQPANAGLPKQFKPIYTGHDNLSEADSVMDESLKEVEEAEAEQKAEQKDQDEKQMALDRSIWGTDLPYYDYIIRTFLEFLAEVAKQEGDSVYTYSPSSSYYQCLPQEINIKTGDTNVAELRLSKNTNWDFQIIIESKDSQNRRPLKIKSKGGGAVFRPNFWVTPNILTIDLFNGDGSVIFTQNRPLPPIEEAQTNIDKGLRAVIGRHAKYLSSTNN